MTYDLTPTSILSLLETTKEQRQSFIARVIIAMQEGSVDPRQIHLQVKCTEEIIKELNSNANYRELVLREAEKHGKKHDFHNATFEIKEVGVKYDYSVCQDEVYNELERQLTELQAKIKERQKFLQMIPEGGIVDPENGNMIYRANKTSTTSPTVKLK